MSFTPRSRVKYCYRSVTGEINNTQPFTGSKNPYVMSKHHSDKETESIGAGRDFAHPEPKYTIRYYRPIKKVNMNNDLLK